MATMATPAQDSHGLECGRQARRTYEAWPKDEKAVAYRYRLATLARAIIDQARVLEK